METTDFDRIASGVIVKSICHPISTIRLDTSIESAWEILMENDWDTPAIVMDSGREVGLIWVEDIMEESKCVKDAMHLLDSTQYLSSNTTVLEAVHIFAERKPLGFLVLEKNEIIGYVAYSHLFNPLGRLAFFALALEIEQLVLNVILPHSYSRTTANALWGSLPMRRQKQICKLYESSFKESPTGSHFDKLNFTELLRRTNLRDKAVIIWKCKVIPGATQSFVLNFFEELRKIRNLCAHPSDIYEFPKVMPVEQLSHFLLNADRIQVALRHASSGSLFCE